MSEYFLGLITFAFVGAIIFSLVPSGIGKRYVRLLCGLCSVGCIAFPIFDLISGGSNDFSRISALFEPYNEIDSGIVEIYNYSLNEVTLKNAEESLKNDIIEEVSAKYDDIDVKIELCENGDDFYINKIFVYLYPSAYGLDPKKIENLCVSRFEAECVIVYK